MSIESQIGNGGSIIGGGREIGSVDSRGNLYDTSFQYRGYIDDLGNVRDSQFRVTGFLDGRGNILGSGKPKFIVPRE